MSPELGRWTAVRSRDPYAGRSTESEEEEGPGDLVREAAETWIALVSLFRLGHLFVLPTPMTPVVIPTASCRLYRPYLEFADSP